MNIHAIRAIYTFEMSRTFRTIFQSIAAPVITTSLYFVVFGSAIGGRMAEIDGVAYGAFIVPGLIMLSILTESIGNASFGIYFPKWSGTIYELLSAPVSIGDTVTAVCTIIDINAERRRVTLKTQCLSGDTVVIDGEADTRFAKAVDAIDQMRLSIRAP